MLRRTLRVSLLLLSAISNSANPAGNDESAPAHQSRISQEYRTDESHVVCGGIIDGQLQDRCESKAAIFESAALGTCPQGSFFDLGLWQCWSCPSGFGRTLAAVDTDRACSIPNRNIKGEFGPATFMGPVCPRGSFYDGIRGGECRSCPAGYRRSAAHVDAGNACFVPAKESLVNATRHGKGTGFFRTDCPRGQFWDGYDGYCHSCPGGYARTAYHIRETRDCSKYIPEKHARAGLVKKGVCEAGEFRDELYQRGGSGGTCWICPKAWDRTVFAVHGSTACEKGGGVEFRKATFEAALTCPAGQHFDFIGLDKSDYKKRSELAGQEVEVIKSGTCWSCPTSYNRTVFHVKSNLACEPEIIEWYSAPYTEPGLFGLPGAAGMLLDITMNYPEVISTAIEAVVETSNGSTDTEAEWKLFRERPGESTAAAAVVFARLLAVVADPDQATVEERKLSRSFSTHIRKKRMHVAMDSLSAYDAWKEAEDYWAAQAAQNDRIRFVSIPPDFEEIAVANMMAITSRDQLLGRATRNLPKIGFAVEILLATAESAGDWDNPSDVAEFIGRTAIDLGAAAAMEAALITMLKRSAINSANQFAQRLAGVATQRTIAMIQSQAASKAGAAATASAASAGPQIVIAATIMVAGALIENALEIENARPKLLAAVAHAKRDPQLARLLKTEKGNQEFFSYWNQAVAGEKKPAPRFMNRFTEAANQI